MFEDLTPAEYQVLLRQDFVSFAARCFQDLNPQADLAMNWHLEVIAAKLTAVGEGKIRRLIINLPPRHLKSLMASIHGLVMMLRGGVTARHGLLQRGVSEAQTNKIPCIFPASREFGFRDEFGSLTGSQFSIKFNGLRCNSLRIGTGNLFRPSRELNRAIREVIR
jgi:hypothetical protein